MRNCPMMLRSLMLALCVVTAPLLAQSPTNAPVSARAAPSSLLEPTAWQLEAGSRWQGNNLQVAPSPEDRIVHTATRPVTLPAGASWRASVTLAAVQPEATNAALGMTLHSADGTFVGVMLRPRERDLMIIRGNGQQWMQPLLRFVPVPGLAGEATATHTLTVESQSSRLRVSVDGQEVGRGAVFDLEPVRVGVRTSQGRAAVQALTLEATGTDERLARLSGARALPGAAVLFQEDFQSKLSAAGAAKMVTGLFGKMLGRTEAAPQPDSSTDAWGENWLNSETRFQRDTNMKRLVLEGLIDDSAPWIVPASRFPLDYAGVAVTARLRVQGSGDAHRAGVMLQALPAAKPKHADSVSLITAMLGENQLWLHEYDARSDEWQLLRSIPWPANGTSDLTMRLVTRDDDAWVFVDGRLVMHHGNAAALRVGGAGLRAEGRSRLEASSFVLSEI